MTSVTLQFEGQEIEALETVEVEARPVDEATSPERALEPTTCERTADSKISAWRCDVPTDVIDLVIRPREFAPHIVWSLDVRELDTDRLPTLTLQRGATISARVEPLRDEALRVETLGDQQGKAAPVRAELRPRQSGFRGDPREGVRARRSATRVPVSSDGALLLSGVAPGTYILAVTQSGAAAWTQTVALDDGEVLHLGEIRLRPPATMEVVVAPPRAPDETSWIVELLRLDPSSGRLRVLADRPADGNGAAVLEDLRSGTLMLRISDVHGDTWHHETIELLEDELFDGATLQRFIDMPLVDVEGLVTRGDEALADVTLLFGGGQGTVQRRATSDDEGRFEITLPREGEWPVDLEDPSRSMEQTLEPVLVERRRGSSTARVEIELPNTVVRGIVLYDGAPVPEAAVTVVRWDDERKRRETILATDDEGSFIVEGASPGRLSLRAASEGLSSPWIETEVVEDLEPPRLEIHLDPLKTLRGRVVFVGRPTSGARIFIRAAATSTGPNLARSVQTDLDGRFTTQVPETVDAVDLIASADGLGVLVTQRTVPAQGEILLALDRASGKLELPRSLVGTASLHVGPTSIPAGLLLSTLTSRIEWTDASIVIRGLAPGAYQLCVAGSCDGGVLPPQGHLDLGGSLAGESHAQLP